MMALFVALICDACGGKSGSVVCADLAPRRSLHAMSRANSWKRVRVGSRGHEDLCAACCRKRPKRKPEQSALTKARQRAARSRRRVDAMERETVPFKPKRGAQSTS